MWYRILEQVYGKWGEAFWGEQPLNQALLYQILTGEQNHFTEVSKSFLSLSLFLFLRCL